LPKDVPSAPSPFPVENDRTALTKAALKRAFRDNLFYEQGKFPALATQKDYYRLHRP
jgi:starch phosphorylase